MNDNCGWIKNDNINRWNEKNVKWLKERLIGCWYGYNKTYP
jgi:hypothetical protein